MDGLSSVEISEYYSVIVDKLNFLDVSTDGVTKLQMLLIQLKTRLDDWQSGGLSKGSRRPPAALTAHLH